jgi:hypothetical protein
MRRTARNSGWITGFVLVALLLAAPVRAHAGTPSGITVTPATTTLSLAKGESKQQASFTIINHYDSVVALHFAFAQSVKTPGTGGTATSRLSISPNDVTLGGGASVSPVLTLTDSDSLSPGSQQIELVITQQAAPGGNVSVVPSIRIPLIVVKEDGAVTSFSVNSLDTPGFAFGLPASVGLMIKNTGNMIAIPRGYISVTDPRGREVSKGVLNTASAATAPGGQLRLSTPLTTLGHAWLPGPYQVQVSYGSGGGRAAQTTTKHSFYLPVWQILLVVLLAAIIYCVRHIWVEWQVLQKLRRDKPPGGQDRPQAMGRGVS